MAELKRSRSIDLSVTTLCWAVGKLTQRHGHLALARELVTTEGLREIQFKASQPERSEIDQRSKGRQEGRTIDRRPEMKRSYSKLGRLGNGVPWFLDF